jgi:hypothetical protein
MLHCGDGAGHGRQIADNCAVDRCGRRWRCSSEPGGRHCQTDNQDLSHCDISLNHRLFTIAIAPNTLLQMRRV